jgi:bacterioferritin-associated ferredoxin
MIICVCKTISESDVTTAVFDGCETFEKMIDKLGYEFTGKDCKICHEEFRKIFEKTKKRFAK